MRAFLPLPALLLVSLTFSSAALADTLEVGPGKPFAKPCDAIAAAKQGDTVEVTAGTYTDTCAIGVPGLTLKGVGGRPVIDLSAGIPAQQKGIYVIAADGVTIENMELTGAHISENSGANGAGLRVQATNFTVRGCFIHDNQNGILGNPLSPGGTLTIESSEFAGNGQGPGCTDGNGCTHNLYLGPGFEEVVFRYNWSHHLATDTPDKGHLFKSRARRNIITYNRFTAEGDTSSYELELPQGGFGVIVGNLIEQGATTGNPSIVAYGKEGLSNPDNRLFVAHNTIVNHLGKGTFLDVAGGAMLVAHNNLLVGMGNPSSTGALSADNLLTQSPMLVDEAGYDYHLLQGSPAIDQGVDPGMADALSLTPTEHYVHPAGHGPRPSDGKLDLGAYEYGMGSMGTGGSGGGGGQGTTSTTGSGGTGGSGGAGQGTTSTTGTTSGGASDTSGGCSCRASGGETGEPWMLLGLVAGVAAIGRRRR